MYSYNPQDDYWRWRFQTYTVEQLQLDYRFTILISASDGSGARVTINVPFWIDRNGDRTKYHPDEIKSLSGALLILHQNVREIVAKRDGTLIILLEDGATLNVFSDPQYEAWEIAGTGDLENMSMLCGPGGSPWGDQKPLES